MPMIFETDSDARFAQTIGQLAYANPFLPERIRFEQEALGDEFVAHDAVWNLSQAFFDADPPNVVRLRDRAERVARSARHRIAAGERGGSREMQIYDDLIGYILYYRIQPFFQQLIGGKLAAPETELTEEYARFAAAHRHFFEDAGVTCTAESEPRHLFAISFQIRRAFFHVYHHIVGSSLPAARLRAAIWQSAFTHDLRRYRRVLFDRMADVSTLVTGPSGTGKELVASAIALSPYIPFDAKRKSFAADFREAFFPLNLSALSPTLIESELFGHRRGAFTGALEDRTGWLEVCPAHGTVFLDEVGELDPAIQVKLLRVLQSRQFQRLGDTKTRTFRGKIIAATNRELAAEMAGGSFRRDFYYRICSDIIATPSLFELLGESAGELRNLVRFIAARIVNSDEADPLADEVTAWIGKHLGREYPWPGNFRELEQCVKNILIRHEYRPATATTTEPAHQFAEDLRAGKLTADDLLRRYCTLVYGQTRNYEETARRLKLDRRTVKAKVQEPGTAVFSPEGAKAS